MSKFQSNILIAAEGAHETSDMDSTIKAAFDTITKDAARSPAAEAMNAYLSLAPNRNKNRNRHIDHPYRFIPAPLSSLRFV